MHPVKNGGITTPAQEAVAVVLRKALLVSLDDLLAVVREFLNPEVSRSGLDRCLRRHGVGNPRPHAFRLAQIAACQRHGGVGQGMRMEHLHGASTGCRVRPDIWPAFKFAPLQQAKLAPV